MASNIRMTDEGISSGLIDILVIQWVVFYENG
jgi:hypothetical protein